MVFELIEGLVGILSSIHADKCTAPWWNEVNGNYVSIFTKSVRELLLLHQLGQVPDPESCTANYMNRNGLSSCIIFQNLPLRCSFRIGARPFLLRSLSFSLSFSRSSLSILRDLTLEIRLFFNYKQFRLDF